MSGSIVVTGKTCTVPHLGITLRSILAACAAAHVPGTSRYFDVKYANVKIGSVSVKDNHDSGQTLRARRRT